MKKILLSTSAILGAITLVTSSASAQTAAMMQDQKASMKGSVGGSVGVLLTGGAAQKVGISLPSWRNYISIKADGVASTLGLNYGAYLRYRPFDTTAGGLVGPDKAFAYFGQKYLGTFTMGRNDNVLSGNLISPTDIVPGYSVDGDAAVGGSYTYLSGYDLTGRTKPLGVSYVTPNVFGVVIGYGYSSPAGVATGTGNPNVTDFAGNILRNTHDVFASYNAAFGPVTLGLMGGYRMSGIAATAITYVGEGAAAVATNAIGLGTASSADSSTGYVGGLKFGFSDGKNFGMVIAGNYNASATKVSNALDSTIVEGSANGWGVGVAFDSPRVAGLTLGVMYASGSVTDNTKGDTAAKTAKTSTLLGVGLGYAWSENFSQTIGYDMVLSESKNNPVATKSSWVLASQVAF